MFYTPNSWTSAPEANFQVPFILFFQEYNTGDSVYFILHHIRGHTLSLIVLPVVRLRLISADSFIEPSIPKFSVALSSDAFIYIYFRISYSIRDVKIVML